MTPSNVGESNIPLVAESAPKLTLSVVTESGAGQPIPCRHIVTLLGSRPGCKIVLPHKKVSPVHMALVHTGSQVFAVDLLSQEGTRLNDLKMLVERLGQDDTLAIGPWRFQVSLEGGDRNGNADIHTFGLEPSPQVIALEHLASHRVLRLDREVCVLGRRSGCDIHVADNAMSRAHALIFNYFGHPVLVDLLSRNHTFVNGEPTLYHELHHDETVTVGETRFKVKLVGSKTVERVAKGVAGVNGPVKVVNEPTGPDLIDIQATEGSQRWHIADSFAKVVGKSG